MNRSESLYVEVTLATAFVVSVLSWLPFVANVSSTVSVAIVVVLSAMLGPSSSNWKLSARSCSATSPSLSVTFRCALIAVSAFVTVSS